MDDSVEDHAAYGLSSKDMGDSEEHIVEFADFTSVSSGRFDELF